MHLQFCFLLLLPSLMVVGVVDGADNVALFWNLYDAVISGGRILHDVAEGVGAVSKAIRAIDSFLDSTAQAQVSTSLIKLYIIYVLSFLIHFLLPECTGVIFLSYLAKYNAK